MVKTRVDYSRALKKLRAARKDAERIGSSTLQQITKEGVLKAKATAPYDTGLTAKAVRSIFLKRGDGAESKIIAPNAHKKEFAKRVGKRAGKFGTSFNLTRYMHSAKGISSGHFRRARPDFMNLTREYLKKIAKTRFEGNFKEIRLKYGR